MKWFQHQSDSSDDIKIKRLEYKLGITGYAVYFKVLEKIAKEGKNHHLDLKKYPLGFLAKEFRLEESTLNEYLTEMNNLSLIVFKKDEIGAPNMKKYTDNWSKRTTKKLHSNYGVATEQLPKEENRIDKNRKEESNSSFKNKKLPNYNGMQMRKKGGKWYCIPKDGGEWLEFAGKEKEIEWK